MKTLDGNGNLQDWQVAQGRVLQELPPNDAAASHRDYWERQHNSVPQAILFDGADPWTTR
jgi:hypothetical protein